jgi:serine phosphatase RsbU (regulator of sigma subunit)
VRAVTGWFRARPALSVAVGVALEAGVGELTQHVDPVRFIGVPGALGVLIAITVALVVGTFEGGLTAVIGGVLFVAQTTGLDQRQDLLRGMPVVIVWAAAALIAGSTAERYRRRTQRALADVMAAQTDAEALSVAFERILESSPHFHGRGKREDVAAAMCSTAIETFACDHASLWTVSGSELRLLAERPPPPVVGLAESVPLGDVPAVREEVVRRGHVAFVPSLDAETASLPWRSRGLRLGLRSSLRVPVAVGGEAAHVLVLSWSAPVPPPSRETLVVAQRFADQASLALERVRVNAAETEVAELHERLEKGLMPTLGVLDAEVEMAAHYRAGERRLLLGGDFYDAVELRDGAIAMLVGDVSGHGAQAAATGATLRAAWRALVLAGTDADGLHSTMQAVLERDRGSEETFVTCCCMWIWPDRQDCTVALAGHPAPLLVDGRPRPLAAQPGPPLGALADAHWAATDLELPHGWQLLLYTDGLIEGRAEPGSSRRLGQDGLIALLEAVLDDGQNLLAGGLARVLEQAEAANGEGFADDVAVVYAAFHPRSAL